MIERFEIENLLEKYCWTVDSKRWGEWIECFASDGVFEVRGRELLGHEAILDYVRANVGEYQLIRHLVHQAAVHVLGPVEATARSYFELRGRTAQGTDVEALGSYEDQLVRTDQGWKFKRRTARFDYYVRKGESWENGGDA